MYSRIKCNKQNHKTIREETVENLKAIKEEIKILIT